RLNRGVGRSAPGHPQLGRSRPHIGARPPESDRRPPSARRMDAADEMIAITSPKIFSKEVAQNRPPHFLARTSLSTKNSVTTNYQGWGQDESLKLKSPRQPCRTIAWLA